MCNGFTSKEDRFYFVHSFRARPTDANKVLKALQHLEPKP